jgi:folate-dependent phosphoribosylglycinamide formyltransferase PurN
MSIAILVGGTSEHGNVQHRYLVGKFLEQFDQQVSCIISARAHRDSTGVRLKRMIKRGNYAERFARARYAGGYGPPEKVLQSLLLPQETDARMPGGERCAVVDSHNNAECEAILDACKPQVIVVYGTAIIKANIFNRAQNITLNMHTGLSPYYRGDSTLFWPVYYDDPDHLGVTVHELVASVDGGAIAATAPVQYESGDSEANLFAKGVVAGTDIYLKAVQQALDGTLICKAQDLSQGREFRWIHRTVAAEKQVLSNLQRWARAAA